MGCLALTFLSFAKRKSRKSMLGTILKLEWGN